MVNDKSGKRTNLAQREGVTTGDGLLEVEIERILPGGLGLAHASGRTVLVALAAPRDRVRVRVGKTRGKTVFARIAQIIEASPHRIAPPCPYFGRCGGCDFQQLHYEAQLSAKVEIIRDCLRRIAQIDPPTEIPIVGSSKPWHYRVRAEWQHDAINEKLGYFERGSHRVCDVAECPVLVPPLQETLSSLRAQMQEGILPRSVEEFAAVAGDEEVSLAPPTFNEKVGEIRCKVGDFNYRLSAESFFQINRELLSSLVEAAIAEARGTIAIDLYCGVGLFTLPLARRFNRVVGVEANSRAITCAQRNVYDARLTNATFECARVSDWLKRNIDAWSRIDFVLLDPPRTGAEENAIERLIDVHPRRINYVSCDPATLARDLKKLLAGGYKLDSIAAFDMFPQTHHVETVAKLQLLDSVR